MLLSSSVSAIIQSVVIVFYSCLNELVFNSQLYYSILLLFSSASFIQSVVLLPCCCLYQVVLHSILLLSSSAGEEHKVVAVLRQDDCFLSKGGYLHIFGATWYELLNVQNQVKIDRSSL